MFSSRTTALGRVNDDVFDAVTIKVGCRIDAEHGVAFRGRDFSPIQDRTQLSGGGRPW